MDELLFTSSSSSEDDGGSMYTNSENSSADSDEESMNSIIVPGSSTWDSDDISYNPSENVNNNHVKYTDDTDEFTLSPFPTLLCPSHLFKPFGTFSTQVAVEK